MGIGTLEKSGVPPGRTSGSGTWNLSGEGLSVTDAPPVLPAGRTSSPDTASTRQFMSVTLTYYPIASVTAMGSDTRTLAFSRPQRKAVDSTGIRRPCCRPHQGGPDKGLRYCWLAQRSDPLNLIQFTLA
ncbi:protein of unknown function [Aminobacter niigataensis]|nr:protein of unknown function [Aminobacter niigataensis]